MSIIMGIDLKIWLASLALVLGTLLLLLIKRTGTLDYLFASRLYRSVLTITQLVSAVTLILVASFAIGGLPPASQIRDLPLTSLIIALACTFTGFHILRKEGSAGSGSSTSHSDAP